VMVWKGI